MIDLNLRIQISLDEGDTVTDEDLIAALGAIQEAILDGRIKLDESFRSIYSITTVTLVTGLTRGDGSVRPEAISHLKQIARIGEEDEPPIPESWRGYRPKNDIH